MALPITKKNWKPKLKTMHESEIWQAGRTVRSLRPENWKQS